MVEVCCYKIMIACVPLQVSVLSTASQPTVMPGPGSPVELGCEEIILESDVDKEIENLPQAPP